MADKLTPLILTALTRAAAEPAGTPLFATKQVEGLFPANALAKTAAKRCIDDGHLRVESSNVTITEKGLNWLLEQQSPKAVLDDLVRVLETRSTQVDDLMCEVKRMADGLAALQGTLQMVLPKATATTVRIETTPDVTTEIQNALAEWSNTAGAAQDCPLPELYKRLNKACSLGTFHDALRRLHLAHRVYLHPWTGPLYTCPEPTYALLVGHEVAWYASPRAVRQLPTATTTAMVS
ncbi:hypothetical protein BH11PLA2_BH11PLA2_03090 [soil metagenome]